MFTFETDRAEFMRTVKILQELAHRNSREKGFWDGPENDNVPTKLCLIHSELSEWLEAHRKGNPVCEKSIPVVDRGSCDARRITAQEEEAADVFIRLLDLCEKQGIDLAVVTLAKMAYNAGRDHRHGGKKC